MWPFRKTMTVVQSDILKGMSDYHSRLLSGVDDGVQTLGKSLETLATMGRLGVREAWLTPHVMEDVPNEATILQGKFQELRRSYSGILELVLAAECMVDNLFEEWLEEDSLLPLEERQHYLLVEISYFSPPIGLLSILQHIQKKDYYPLLAYPERYEYVQKKDYKTLREEHTSFQPNVPSLIGVYGRHVQEKTEALLKAEMHDCIGCDTHSIGYYKTLVDSTMEVKIIEMLQRQSKQ